MLQLLDTMDKEIHTDLDTYNSALTMLAKPTQWKKPANVVDWVIEARLQPNQEAARAAVDSCVAGERKDDAAKSRQQIEAIGTVVDDEIKAST